MDMYNYKASTPETIKPDKLDVLQLNDYSNEMWVELLFNGEDTPYEVSDHGRIRKEKKIMSQHDSSTGNLS